MRRISNLCRALVALAILSAGAAMPAAADDVTLRDSGRDQIGALADWPGWQKDLIGTRFNPVETAITPSSVAGLKLKWAFVFPNQDNQTGSQPAVVGDTLYVGGRDAKLYALNARTGATKWTYDVTAVSGAVDATNINPLRDGPTVSGNNVVFGDTRGWVYDVNATTGQLIWATRVSDHPAVAMTSSPIVYQGRVYIGVSSQEEVRASNAAYPCCTFRGQMVSLNLSSGSVAWRYYTVPPAAQTGVSANGTPQYGPSGVAVWSSPVIDPVNNTVVFATGNNYTGTEGDGDSVIVVDATTGALKWKKQMTHPDQWTVSCHTPDQTNCVGLTDGSNLDFDFGATPNIFYAGGRELVGIGQKSGVYHALDIRTGEIVWQQQVSTPVPNGGESGIEWGTSYDGTHLYVASWQAAPGTLFALDPGTGKVLWSTPNPADGCTTGGAAAFPSCTPSMITAVSSTPGLVWEGSVDGKIRAYRSNDGTNVWQYDTIRDYTGVNGLTGSGGSISGNGGPVISHGMLYVESGYNRFFGLQGKVLLAFGL
jgi:polyvinyl alcohol dehydrogenase (cytochrome)